MRRAWRQELTIKRGSRPRAHQKAFPTVNVNPLTDILTFDFCVYHQLPGSVYSQFITT